MVPPLSASLLEAAAAAERGQQSAAGQSSMPQTARGTGADAVLSLTHIASMGTNGLENAATAFVLVPSPFALRCCSLDLRMTRRGVIGETRAEDFPSLHNCI